MRRVGHQRHLDVVVAEHLNVGAGRAEVILHIAGPVGLRRVEVALELAEDLRVGLADDVGQHVEAATVRHPDDHLVEAVLGGLVDHRIHHRDHRFSALQREPFLPNVFGLQKGFERLGGVELAQDVLLLGHRRLVVFDLDALLQPALLLGFEDMGVLHADVPAIGVAQHREHVT